MITLADFVRSIALVLSLVTGVAMAQGSYPSQPIRIIIPGGAGGINDIAARLIAPGLSQRLGQPVIVENKPGAGTTLGGNLVAKAKPDGHTLLMAVSTLAINPSSILNMPYDAIRDFSPITHALTAPLLFVVPSSSGVKSIKEFLTLAKTKPGGVTYGSAGYGTNPHLAMELLATKVGVKLYHIPYNGTIGINSLLGGHVESMATVVSSLIPHVRSGRLTALGVTSTKRLAILPDVPTFAEEGIAGFEPDQWVGLLAPAKTPPEIIARLHKETVALMQSPEFIRAMTNVGVEVVTSTPEEFAAFLKSETVKWTEVAKAAGIKPE